MSNLRKFTAVSLSKAFSIAILKASLEISIPKTSDAGKCFFKLIAIHPDPVPISIIEGDVNFSLLHSVIMYFTSSSVSGRGINVYSLTFKVKSKKYDLPVIYCRGHSFFSGFIASFILISAV